MAVTSYCNVRYHSGPVLKKRLRRAYDGQTWQAGQFGRYTDSGIVKCIAGSTQIQLIFSQTQATATSSSDVYVEYIPSSSTKFVIGVSNAGNDTKAPSTLLGGNYGLDVNSCVCTLSAGDDSNESLHVEDLMSTLESFSGLYDTSDVPGYVIISIPDSVINAEGSGL